MNQTIILRPRVNNLNYHNPISLSYKVLKALHLPNQPPNVLKRAGQQQQASQSHKSRFEPHWHNNLG